MTRVGENFVRCIAVAHFAHNATAGASDSTKWGLFELTFSVDGKRLTAAHARVGRGRG